MKMTAERALEALGLRPGADAGQVQRAYRALAMATHPDRGGDAERMKELNEARDVALEHAPPAKQRAPRGKCRTCGGSKKVKVARGFESVELACPQCAVEG